MGIYIVSPDYITTVFPFFFEILVLLSVTAARYKVPNKKSCKNAALAGGGFL